MQASMNMTTSPVLFDYPNPRINVFLIMRFRDTPQNREIHTAIREPLARYGMNLLRADAKRYSHELWANVRAYMDGSQFGIAVFEQIDKRDFNPNVSLEVGYMLAQTKPVLLLKEQHLRGLPSDLVGSLYRTFDSNSITATIDPQIRHWLQDVGVAKSPAERLVMFVSNGGTCRCAMAKVALQQVLRDRELPYRLRVESIAHKFGGTNEASEGARRAVYEAYGADYLQTHRVTRRSPGLAEDSDLILVMETKLKTGLPPAVTFSFNEFFGLRGNVRNPWPYRNTKQAREEYSKCMSHIRKVIDAEYEKILEYLDRREAA